jgi:hypothetical protein
MKNPFNPFRRRFIAKASLGAAASLGLPGIVSAAYAETKADKITLAKDDVILFQGDSITDAGRKHNETNPNNSGALGGGYAFMAGSELLYKHAPKNLRVYNKGISGNKVYQLAERWEADCLALKPNVLSLLIGVNDFWHTLTNNYTGTAAPRKNWPVSTVPPSFPTRPSSKRPGKPPPACTGPTTACTLRLPVPN